MLINLIALGAKMPAWVNEGFRDYQQRLRGDLTMRLHEIPLRRRLDPGQLRSAQEWESREILQRVSSSYLVILDGGGTCHSSASLAQRLQFWQENQREMALVIGAPEGLGAEVRRRAQESWSLGALTFPHPLVRIMVAEAIYRAWLINKNHPYHRA